MFKPHEIILYYSLLISQEAIIDISSNLSIPAIIKKRMWYENKKLITNDNIFDINELQKIFNDSFIDASE